MPNLLKIDKFDVIVKICGCTLLVMNYYHGWWWPSDTRSQGISRYDINLDACGGMDKTANGYQEFQLRLVQYLLRFVVTTNYHHW